MKITLNQIQDEANQKGWKVLSDKYINLNSEMEFECPEGHKIIQSYKKIRNKFICPICSKNPLKLNNNLIIPKNKKSRLLALDQATQICGYSLWDGDQLIKYGIFKAHGKNNIERISQIHNWLLNLINNFSPDIIILEDIQLQDFSQEEKFIGQKQNIIGITTFKTLAELLGVLQVELLEDKIDFKVIPSATWRKGVGIKGRTRVDKKRSAQQLVKSIYGINVTEDEADAICIGLYGINNCQQPKIIKWE